MKCANCEVILDEYQPRYFNPNGDTICSKCDDSYSRCDLCNKLTYNEDMYERGMFDDQFYDDTDIGNIFESNPILAGAQSICSICIKSLISVLPEKPSMND